MQLRSKTAVVTGSSRGIGRAIALRLAQEGADVIVHGHAHADDAHDVAIEIADLDVKSHVMMADVSDARTMESFIDDAWKWKDGIDVWVNNAGADVLTGKVANLSFQQKLDHLWQIDVLGTIVCSRAVGQRMKRVGGGVILNIGWDQAWEGMEGDSGEMFATVKGAIMSFTKSLAKSLSPEVRVNCVAPGWIKTSWGEHHASEYWQQRAMHESLRSRWGTPKDIADAVCFLASPAADFINGQILPVNGGFQTSQQRDE